MSDMADPLREQLIKARRNITRQLEIMQSPATVTGKGGLASPDNRALVAELQRQLRGINEALAGLDFSN